MFVCPECGEGFGGPGRCTRDGVDLVDGAGDELLGRSVGPYRIACRIGAGGMGQVYKGVHPSIGSRVAVKVLAGDLGRQQSLVERFFAEARAVNVIRHESIVNVLDLAWLPDGRPYIVMEYLDGQALSAVIRQRGPLPLGSVSVLLSEVLDALVAAHAQGIVHRDLKPDNIFVTLGGRAKVLDFGIAKLRPDLATGSDATATGSILGTPHYMAPEQALGRPVDARADLYAVGVILFECATGQRPFQASSLYELLRQHVEAPVPSVLALRPELPPGFEAIVRRALEKDPGRRFASAVELSGALAALSQSLPREVFPSLGGRPAGANHGGQASLGTGSTSFVSTGAHTSPSFAGGATGASYYTASGATFAGPGGRGSRWLWLALLLGGLGVLGLLGLVLVAGAVGAWSLQPGVATGEQPGAATGESRRVQGDASAAPLANPLGRSGPIEWNWQKPKGFDPRRLDVAAHLAQGEDFAGKSMPDRELILLSVSGVDRDGMVDLSLSSAASAAIIARWRSPTLSQRPADLPIGAALKVPCTYVYMVGEMGVFAGLQDHMGCDEKTLPKPTCSVRQVLAKAASRGAPAGKYVADVTYLRQGAKGAGWTVKIGDFQTLIDDGC